MPYEILINDFNKVKRKGYIKSVGHGTSSVGRTFEKELMILENNLPFADFYGIEIKCSSRDKDSYITLFSMEPESQEGNVIKQIAQKYGYPDKDIKKSNILNSYVCGKKKSISLKYKGEIIYDHSKNNVVLLISDNYNRIIDYEAKWNIEHLDDRFRNKCEKLAIIDAERKFFNGVEYIKYKEIKIYEYKGIKYYLKELASGIARIQFKVTVYKSGEKKGELHNHGTSFQIKYSDIESVYKRVY